MAKQTNIPPAGEQPVSAPKYKTIGLQQLDYMPVHYAGETYNLADLTDQQLDILLESGYPHLVRI